MKYLYVLICFTILFSCNAQEKEKLLNIEELRNKDGKYYFKGYQKNLMVFDDVINNVLYATDNLESFSVIKRYDKDLNVKFVNESGIVYVKNDTLISEFFTGTKDLFVSNSKIYFVTANNELNKIVFNDKDWQIEVWDRINNKLVDKDLKGGMPYLVENTIYYLDKKELKQISLNGEESKTILENVTGDPWIMSRNGNYAFLMAKKEDVGLKPAIYDFQKNEFDFIDISLSYLVFFSPNDKIAYFYNTKTFDLKPYNLETKRFN
ncbi:MAG: hypothetical protein A2041_13170 [Bacteroidetes bacterium GWA2_31_9b]|nr:MAG: hypothetical protein A2041_13170 [Bacteroidetes bacterium GWA2_31_9b]